MMKVGDGSNRSMDELSKLPEDVLDHILCFLSLKESVRTCVLSKSWRHRGSTRSKLELSLTSDFRGNRKTFLSVLDDSLQRYHDRKLCVKQLSLEMLTSISTSVKFDLHSIASKLELLQELCLKGCDLRRINYTDDKPLFMHLLKLSLGGGLYSSNEALEMLLSRCPSTEYLCLLSCNWLGNMNLSKADNLKHFVCWQCKYPRGYNGGHSIEIEVPTLETIRIENCMNWYSHDKYFPRLQGLYLKNVKLSEGSFDFFTSDYMPSLEELELDRCYGFREFQLSSPSIKHLSITRLRDLIKATIDAPNVICFKLWATSLPPSISLMPISREWKSLINLSFPHFPVDPDHIGIGIPWIGEIYDVLKEVSLSQITLQLLDHPPALCNRISIELTKHHGFCKPVVVENLILRGDYSSSTSPVIFNCLFRVCRPRYIYNPDRDIIDLLWEILKYDVERRPDYFWRQDLMEVSIETKCSIGMKWNPVHGNSLSECALPNKQKIRLGLTWRG